VISPQKLDEVCALVKATLAEEANAGFPRLSLCPSSYTIKFLDCFATLGQPDRDALFAVPRAHRRRPLLLHQREAHGTGPGARDDRSGDRALTARPCSLPYT